MLYVFKLEFVLFVILKFKRLSRESGSFAGTTLTTIKENYRLSLLGIYCQKQNSLFDYDLLTNQNIKIEVKTSTIHNEKPNKNSSKNYKRDYWSFRNCVKERDCDFYCFICLSENLKIEKMFVVPQSKISERNAISIPREFKMVKTYNNFSLKYYEDRIDLLVKDKQNY